MLKVKKKNKRKHVSDCDFKFCLSLSNDIDLSFHDARASTTGT